MSTFTYAAAPLPPELREYYARGGYRSTVTLGALMDRNRGVFGRLTAVILTITVPGARRRQGNPLLGSVVESAFIPYQQSTATPVTGEVTRYAAAPCGSVRLKGTFVTPSKSCEMTSEIPLGQKNTLCV